MEATTNIRKEVGNRIRYLREKRGLTQEQLAELTAMHRPNITRIEKGTCSVGLDVLFRLVTALDCSIQIQENKD